MKIFRTIKLSNTLKKEITRYVISFFFAWLVAALISDFPFFKQHLIENIGLDDALTKLTIFLTKAFLNLLQFHTFSSGSFIQIKGTTGINYAYGCLGLRELAFFVIFIVLQFGKLKHKTWYIPLGILLLLLLNAIRGTIIAIGQYNNPANTDLIHDIVSPIIMYPAILFLWLFWVSKYGKVPSKSSKLI